MLVLWNFVPSCNVIVLLCNHGNSGNFHLKKTLLVIWLTRQVIFVSIGIVGISWHRHIFCDGRHEVNLPWLSVDLG